MAICVEHASRPNPAVRGGGFDVLREAGLDVQVGVEAERGARLIEAFAKSVTQNLPVLAVQELNAPSNFDRVFTLASGPPAPAFPGPGPT